MLTHFFCTSETIPSGLGFSHYGPVHIFWLCLFGAATLLSCLHYRSLGDSGRSVWRKVIAVLLIADELYKQIGLIAFGNWQPDYLPLHLCSINIFLIAVHAFRPNQALGNFLYTVCIPGALAALLFPTWTGLPLQNFMHTHSFSVHILLAMYPIVLTAGGDICPNAKQLPKCVAALAAMALIAWLINPLLDANFFFMASAGKGNPLYWFEVNWGSHLLGFPMLVSAVLLVMHGPWAIVRKIKSAKA